MFEGLFQPAHLLVIFLIAIVVFGPKKLPELGKGLGEAIRGFKKALNEDDKKPIADPESPNKDQKLNDR
jgi:sec-independent protein translocase protein TatA